MEEKENNSTIILDNGTSCIKAGFAGEQPQIVIPTIVGNSKFGNSFLIGNDAFNKRDELQLNNPMERGIIKNWDEIEKIWNHIFTDELKIIPKSNNILLTEPIYNLKNKKKKKLNIYLKLLISLNY